MRVRRYVFAPILCLLCGIAQAQDLTRISPDQARAASIQLLQDGQTEEALKLAQLLLQRNPEDVSALLVSSEAMQALGNTAAMGQFARRAFGAAVLAEDRFYAARLAANAYAAEGKDTRAQIWLRLASEYAPTQTASDAIARDFRTLRQRNPWTVNLSFGIVPTSNINGGSENTTFFGGLKGSSPPLSGLNYSGDVNLSYRIASSQTSATFLQSAISVDAYRFSDEAKQVVIDQNLRQSESDFARGRLSFGIRHRAILTDGAMPTDFGLTLERAWNGGDPDADTATIYVSQPFQITDNDTFTLTLRAQEKRDFELENARSGYVGMSWQHMFEQSRVRFTLSREHSTSANLNDGFERHSLAIGYDYLGSIAGFSFSASASLSESNYDRRPFTAIEDRTDTARNFSLTVQNENIDFFGFQPTLTFSRSYVDSTFPLFERAATNLAFDFRSAF